MRQIKRALGFAFRFSEAFFFDAQYSFRLGFLKNTPHKSIAIVLHLYYPELWPQFETCLNRLKEKEFDLFITIPRNKTYCIPSIVSSFPDARILIVPNRGRDVLPFLKLSPILRESRYSWVLKLHSKRSPQISQGAVWSDSMLNSLIPTNIDATSQLSQAMNDPYNGMIGPAGYFFSGANLMSQNKSWLAYCQKTLLKRRFSEFDVDFNEAGFFAGTMFWLRPELIKPLELFASARLFEPERGQTDGTLAHSIERLLPIAVAAQGKSVLQIGTDGIRSENPVPCDATIWQGEPIFSS